MRWPEAKDLYCLNDQTRAWGRGWRRTDVAARTSLNSHRTGALLYNPDNAHRCLAQHIYPQDAYLEKKLPHHVNFSYFYWTLHAKPAKLPTCRCRLPCERRLSFEWGSGSLSFLDAKLCSDESPSVSLRDSCNLRSKVSAIRWRAAFHVFTLGLPARPRVYSARLSQ